MKKIFSVILALIFVLLLIPAVPAFAAYNSALEVSADIVLLQSLDDGSVIFEKNADKRTAPASLTKISTAALVLEHCKNLDELVTVKRYCIDDLSGTGSSMAGLVAGEEISVRNLLYCMLVKSANEAANILADYVAGGLPEFVDMLNAFAVRLGCADTHFANVHGLDDAAHYTTARDLTKIAKYAMSLPGFMEIASTYTYRLPATNKHGERNLLSTNWMINPNFKTYYCKYAEGIKTGTTSGAGHCIISKASKDGYNYLAVVMGAPEQDVNGDGNPDNCAFLDCKKMFEWVFANIRLQRISDPNEIITVVDVKRSWNVDHIRLVPEKEVTALVPVGTDSTSVLVEVIREETPSVVKAPIKKGDVLGKARILYAEEEITTINLVAAEDVNVSVILWLADGVKTVVTSTAFLIIAAAAVVLLLAFLILRAQNTRKRRKRAPVVVKHLRKK